MRDVSGSMQCLMTQSTCDTCANFVAPPQAVCPWSLDKTSTYVKGSVMGETFSFVLEVINVFI